MFLRQNRNLKLNGGFTYFLESMGEKPSVNGKLNLVNTHVKDIKG